MGENVTRGEFTPLNINNCGRRNVRKQRYIKNGEKDISFYISLHFGSLDKMKITSSEPKDNWKIRKGVDDLSGSQDHCEEKSNKGKVCHY